MVPDTLMSGRRPSRARMSGRLESMVGVSPWAAGRGPAGPGRSGRGTRSAARSAGCVEDLRAASPSRGDPAAVHEHDLRPTSRAKLISWVTTIMVMPSSASCCTTVSTSPTSSGIERRGDLVEQQHLRLHGDRAGDADPLLLPARELGRQAVQLVRRGRRARANARPVRAPRPSASRRTLRRPEHDVLDRGQMREQVEQLEHHADLGADRRQLALAAARACCAVAVAIADLDAVDLDASPRRRARAG